MCLDCDEKNEGEIDQPKLKVYRKGKITKT